MLDLVHIGMQNAILFQNCGHVLNLKIGSPSLTFVPSAVECGTSLKTHSYTAMKSFVDVGIDPLTKQPTVMSLLGVGLHPSEIRWTRSLGEDLVHLPSTGNFLFESEKYSIVTDKWVLWGWFLSRLSVHDPILDGLVPKFLQAVCSSGLSSSIQAICRNLSRCGYCPGHICLDQNDNLISFSALVGNKEVC